MSIDVAISVGHDVVQQGATAVDGMREWAFFSPVADLVLLDLQRRGYKGQVFFRPARGTYEAKMRALCAGINAARPRLVVELHFNANGGGVRSTIAMHWPSSKKGQAAAVTLAAAVAEGLARGRRHRALGQARSWAVAEDLDGDGQLDPAGPPLWVLQLTQAPCVILETHFGDNLDDHQLARAARDSGDLARIIAGGIAAALRGL